MKDIILTPYAPYLVESTRSIGYSFETALADIIDNSISNYANRIDVKFNTGQEPYVAVIDDGTGMTKGQLEQAMRYGSSSSLDAREEIDLGRFGLGLKMASMSQCRKLTVLSKQRGKISAATWDLDHINKTKEWSLITYSSTDVKNLKFYDDLNKQTSGTVVLWEELDRISESPLDFDNELNQKIDYANKHLGLVFHRYLENKLMKNHFDLYFNNLKVEPIDPFMKDNKATQPLEEEILHIDKIAIKVKPYIIPYVSKLSAKERQTQDKYKDLNINQGLYIYRNMRLIVWGKWFYLLRDSELQRLSRIQIDLPNNIDDYWTIDVKKSSAQIPSSLKARLKQIIVRSVGKSERVYKYRGRKISNDNYEHVWNKVSNREKMQYLVNRELPIYKALEDSLDEEQGRLLDALLKSIEDSFPYASVYYDLAKDEQYEEKTMEIDEVYQLAKITLDKLKGNTDSQRAAIKTLNNIDMFRKYPEVITMLEGELEIG